MSIEVKEKCSSIENKLCFPKLMVHENGSVVLFTQNRRGTEIKVANKIPGYYSNLWDMRQYRDYQGTLELSNGRSK